MKRQKHESCGHYRDERHISEGGRGDAAEIFYSLTLETEHEPHYASNCDECPDDERDDLFIFKGYFGTGDRVYLVKPFLFIEANCGYDISAILVRDLIKMIKWGVEQNFITLCDRSV